MRNFVPSALVFAAAATLASAQVAAPKPEAGKKTDAKPAAATPAPKAASAKPAATPAPKAAPAPAPKSPSTAANTPAEGTPKKKNILQRVFGKKEKATPAPATPAPATPAPAAPKPKPKPRSTAAAESDAPAKEEKPAPTDSAPAAANPDGATTPTDEKPAATPAPTKKGRGGKKGAAAAATEDAKPEVEKTKEQLAVDKAVAGGDAEVIEKAKYDEVKSRASRDAKVKELREKANAAVTDDEGRKALRAYNKALFQKMRSLDSGLGDRINRMETAVMKQLDGDGQ